ncbi:uncharacterized protein LOC131168059 [Malania oleifera]|uniref:uncharacterized protein LOC131168059 n=1 Tax=Malania oleifera TaxID=397392 RepID=UPI0025AE7F22|nr:uncharacterized protein LOC131168059 [Malania oleifera]
MGQVISNFISYLCGGAKEKERSSGLNLLTSQPDLESQSNSGSSSAFHRRGPLIPSAKLDLWGDSCRDLGNTNGALPPFLVVDSNYALDTSLKTSPPIASPCSDVSASVSFHATSPPCLYSSSDSGPTASWRQEVLFPQPKSNGGFDLFMVTRKVLSEEDDLQIYPPKTDLCIDTSVHDAFHQGLVGTPLSSGSGGTSVGGFEQFVVVDSNVQVEEYDLGGRQVSPRPQKTKGRKCKGQKKITEPKKEEEVKLCKQVVVKEKWIKHYSNQHKILLVGEGDFSFSACLALAFGSATNMIATSLNSVEFLTGNYGKALDNIRELKVRGCKVMHGVDATKMKYHGMLKQEIFDRIIFNFPHAGFSHNESQESQISRHKKLVRLFLKNAKKLISGEGEIHISHKSNGFHSQWKLEELASNLGLRTIGKVRFQLADYPGYNTKYGYGGDKNFNCYPSKTYKFGP